MFMCDRTCDLFKVGNFNIKRCLLFLVCIMLLVACGENDPIESRNRHPRQQEESHSEQSGSVPAVAKEDVAAYFRFDMSRDINVALGLVEAQKETLQINGKMIKITEAVVKRKDYQKGSFVLYVTGTVNGSPFKNEFTFTGFVSKPDDYQMVNGRATKSLSPIGIMSMQTPSGRLMFHWFSGTPVIIWREPSFQPFPT